MEFSLPPYKLFPLYRWGNGGLGRLGKEPSVTEPVRGRAGIRPLSSDS